MHHLWKKNWEYYVKIITVTHYLKNKLEISENHTRIAHNNHTDFLQVDRRHFVYCGMSIVPRRFVLSSATSRVHQISTFVLTSQCKHLK